MKQKEAGMRGIGIGNRRLSDECNTGKTIAKSLLNYKGIKYNGDGMLLGQLNVVNIGLLLLIAEDESRGGGLREKSQCTTSLHCWGGSH